MRGTERLETVLRSGIAQCEYAISHQTRKRVCCSKRWKSTRRSSAWRCSITQMKRMSSLRTQLCVFVSLKQPEHCANIAMSSGSRQAAAPTRFDRLRWKQVADRCGEHQWSSHRSSIGTTCSQYWSLRATRCCFSTTRRTGEQAARLRVRASTRVCGRIGFDCVGTSSYCRDE